MMVNGAVMAAARQGLKCIGILAHPLRPQTAPVAAEIAASLRTRGIETWLYTRWDAERLAQEVAGTDMVIAIGGDGAMLRAARVCAPSRVPVLGVNMGQLGFLTEISSSDAWEEPLEAVLRGEYWIEERMMIHAALLRDDVQITAGDALNDVVISRGAATRMISLETYIDKDW